MSDFNTATQRKARKDHVCVLCATKILKGQSYIDETGVWEGDFFNHKLHKNCYDHITLYCSENGETEYSFDEVNDWMHEKYCFNCCHYDDSMDCMLESDPAYCDRFMPKVKEAQDE